MSELTLGTEPGKGRSMLLPILLAVLVVLIASLWFKMVYVHPAVTGSVSSATVYPVHVEYKPPKSRHRHMMTLGAPQVEDSLYVVADVTLKDQSDVPLFLSSFRGSFTLADGSVMQATTIEHADLPRLFAMFPDLKALADATGTQPLQRDQTVPNDSSGRGYVVMYYNITQPVWDKRRMADISIDFYHQEPITLPLPR